MLLKIFSTYGIQNVVHLIQNLATMYFNICFKVIIILSQHALTTMIVATTAHAI